ncbi:MAG: radical SAM protein, partial [Clostridiales bacterium]|nr:radical SAM protein [Clostridiales bacterium]
MLCNLCPRKCGKERNNQIGLGECGMSNSLKIAHYQLFMYEEPCISVGKGSGAIFFSGCNLKCIFCQNYDISTLKHGKEISILELVEIFKELENLGAENINLVSPMHYALQIVEALKIYKPKVPVIYNTN